MEFIFSEDDDAPAIDIMLPKRKDELEAEKQAEAKKAFAKKLAEIYTSLQKSNERWFSHAC